jgi:hypothetical protein
MCRLCVVVRGGGDVTIISSTTVQCWLFVSIPFNHCFEPYFAPGISKRGPSYRIRQLSKCMLISLYMLITNKLPSSSPKRSNRISFFKYKRRELVNLSELINSLWIHACSYIYGLVILRAINATDPWRNKSPHVNYILFSCPLDCYGFYISYMYILLKDIYSNVIISHQREITEDYGQHKHR